MSLRQVLEAHPLEALEALPESLKDAKEPEVDAKAVEPKAFQREKPLDMPLPRARSRKQRVLLRSRRRTP